jgi:hypothetical protein
VLEYGGLETVMYSKLLQPLDSKQHANFGFEFSLITHFASSFFLWNMSQLHQESNRVSEDFLSGNASPLHCRNLGMADFAPRSRINLLLDIYSCETGRKGVKEALWNHNPVDL